MYDYTLERRINEERIRRLTDWYKGREVGPIHIDAELHKRCNLKCSFCPRSASDYDLNEESKNKELRVERWLAIVKEAEKLGVMVFNLEGANEPIAVRELAFPVMDEVKNVGMYGILTTNGTLFTERDIKRLVQIAWDRIHFSIDSFDQKIHDQLRGRSGTFKRAVKAIKLLNKYKRKLKTDRPMLNINIVINKLNYFSLPRMVQFCHKLKADYIFVEPLIIFSDGGKKIKLSREQTEKELPKYVQEAKRLADGYGIDNNFATQDENLRKELVEEAGSIENVLIDDVESISNGTILSSPCFKPWTRMAIKYDGLTGHCGLIQAGEDVKVKSLEEIWFGQWLNRIRKRMIRKQLLEHCSHCIPSDITQRRRFRAELKQAIGEKIGKNN